MSTDQPDAEPRRFFDETGGLHTETNLHSIHGTSPVRVERAGENVRLEICLSGGEVAAVLKGETARDLADALRRAADGD